MPVSRKIALGTGLDYHVLEWGAGDPSLEHTVVLLHGFLDLSWGWVHTVRAGLEGRFHLVAPDMRGHGDSDRVGPGGYYHFLDYLADLHELIDAVGRQRVSLVGHSMGGTIASYYTGAFPDRIFRLALLEGAGPPERDIPVPERVVTWIAGWRRARTRPARTCADITEAAERLRLNDPLLDEALARELAEHGTTKTADGRLRFKHDPLHLTLSPYPFRVDVAGEFWGRITCPVLLVEGAESGLRYPPEEAERRHSAFRDAEHAIIDGAGHMMQRHQPQKLAELLMRFLGESG